MELFLLYYCARKYQKIFTPLLIHSEKKLKKINPLYLLIIYLLLQHRDSPRKLWRWFLPSLEGLGQEKNLCLFIKCVLAIYKVNKVFFFKFLNLPFFYLKKNYPFGYKIWLNFSFFKLALNLLQIGSKLASPCQPLSAWIKLSWCY